MVRWELWFCWDEDDIIVSVESLMENCSCLLFLEGFLSGSHWSWFQSEHTCHVDVALKITGCMSVNWIPCQASVPEPEQHKAAPVWNDLSFHAQRENNSYSIINYSIKSFFPSCILLHWMACKNCSLWQTCCHSNSVNVQSRMQHTTLSI